MNLIGAILSRLFAPTLYDMTFEREFAGGIGKIDIFFRNSGDRGILKHIRDSYEIKSPYVYVECKNIGNDLSGGEFGQMATRLTSTRSHLGILVCRKNKNPKEVLKHARAVRTNEDNLVLWLEDDDIMELLLNADDKNQIDKIIQDRLDQVDV